MKRIVETAIVVLLILAGFAGLLYLQDIFGEKQLAEAELRGVIKADCFVRNICIYQVWADSNSVEDIRIEFRSYLYKLVEKAGTKETDELCDRFLIDPPDMKKIKPITVRPWGAI